MRSFFKECCSDAWLELIKTTGQQILVKAKKPVFTSGEEAKGIYEIISGKVKVTSKDSSGNEFLLRLAGDNNILGHRGIGGDWMYHVTATALTDTELLFIPKKTFEILARTNPEFSYRLMTFFAEELKHAEERTLHMPVINRIAGVIVLNYEAFGINEKTKELNFTISRQDIANRAITSYESTIRALADLKEMKIIDTDNKSIIIKDLKKLIKLAKTV